MGNLCPQKAKLTKPLIDRSSSIIEIQNNDDRFLKYEAQAFKAEVGAIIEITNPDGTVRPET